jgi:hypothetical protein
VAQPQPPDRGRNATVAGTHWDQLIGPDGVSCLRARQTLSLMLDGEAATADVANSAPHIFGCEHCREFAAAVAKLVHTLRSSSGEPLRTRNHVAPHSADEGA